MSYYASTYLFIHTHVICGATITHSHIHTNSHHDTKNGGHTEHSITLIAQISHLESIDFTCESVPTPLQFPLHENKFVETAHWVASICFENLLLRAPPIV